ncbi:hypothetical protein D3C76_1417080 [compost metagenome]
MVEGFRYVEHHVVGDQPAPVVGLLAGLPTEEQTIRQHTARQQSGGGREEPAPTQCRACRGGQGIEHGLEALDRGLSSHFVVS